MGTTYSVQLVDPPPDLDLDRLRLRIDAELERVNAQMSTYRPDSELSRFNAAPGTDWMPVSPELAATVAAAKRIGAASGGALDVTVGPLVNLWGFGPDLSEDDVPAPAAIAAGLDRTGLERLEVRLDPPALRKARADLYVDLSAIAKGHGADRVAAVLDTAGVDDLLVEIGGELYGRGRNGRGEPWRIAVERPQSDGRRVLRVVPLRNTGMATSGDYRNFFELDGVRYSHSIDPATGWPVRHELASVTVLADTAMEADGWATALLVLGPARGQALAESLGLAALFIERHDDDRLAVTATSAFERRTAGTQP
jgi:thiamine biosynthesis lipoprotein